MSYHLNLQQIVQNFLQDLYKAHHSSLAKSGATVTTYRHQTSRGRKIHQILEFCINLEVPRNLVCLEILEAWKSCVTWILRVSSHVSPSSLLCMSPCCLVRSEAPLHSTALGCILVTFLALLKGILGHYSAVAPPKGSCQMTANYLPQYAKTS